LGSHELYLHARVYSHNNLTDDDRILLMMAFSGSREIPLFDALYQPLLWRVSHGDESAYAELAELLWRPGIALRRGGSWHHRYRQYQQSGQRLHTTCYRCFSPGVSPTSGEEFTFFIVDQTKRFIELGHKLLARINQPVAPSLLEVEAVLQTVRTTTQFRTTFRE
jgi:hypothetical protein